MNVISRVAAYVHCTCGHPLEVPTVFHPQVVAEFLENHLGYSQKVTLMWAGRLSIISRRLQGLPDDDGNYRGYQMAAWRPDPYTDEEVGQVLDWAQGQRTAMRRGRCSVPLSLTLGAGLTTREVADLRLRDITVDELGVLVKVRKLNVREVPVLARYEQPLIELARAAGGSSEFVFIPNSKDRQTRIVTNFISSCHQDSGMKVDAQRARATWIVGHIVAGIRPAAIAKARWLGEPEGLHVLVV